MPWIPYTKNIQLKQTDEVRYLSHFFNEYLQGKNPNIIGDQLWAYWGSRQTSKTWVPLNRVEILKENLEKIKLKDLI